MKKNQNDVNAFCTDLFSFVMQTPTKRAEKLGRLYSCQAHVWRYDGEFIVLRSYDTPVAVYDIQSETLIDVLRYIYGYSATSAQHIAKFKRWLNEHYMPIYNDLRYYPV